MANKIIGRTDTSGAVNLGSITSNSKRPILVVGEGIDETKEVIFKVRGTNDAAEHFGPNSPCNDIIKALIRNGVKVVRGICVGDVGTMQDVEEQVTKTRTVNKTVAASNGEAIVGDDGEYTIIDDPDTYMVDKDVVVAADEEGNATTDNTDRDDGYTIIDNPDSYTGDTTTVTIQVKGEVTTVEVTEEYADTVTVKKLVGGAYASKAEAYEAAFRQSLTDGEIMTIILDTTDKATYRVLAEHLAEAEDADIYRYGVVGVPAEVTNIDDVIALSASIDSDRMFIGFPNVVDDNNVILDGTLTAAGIASILNTKTDDPALPTNNISMAGFGGVSDRVTEDTMNELADAGIVAIFPEDSAPTIWRMVTTAQKSSGSQALESIWHDATTRLIADNVLGTVLAKLKANYKRTKNVSRVLDSIRTDVINVLDNKLALEIIEEYDPNFVTVVKDPEDRYGALVDYEYKVVSPLYTITVTQHIKI